MNAAHARTKLAADLATLEDRLAAELKRLADVEREAGAAVAEQARTNVLRETALNRGDRIAEQRGVVAALVNAVAQEKQRLAQHDEVKAPQILEMHANLSRMIAEQRPRAEAVDRAVAALAQALGPWRDGAVALHAYMTANLRREFFVDAREAVDLGALERRVQACLTIGLPSWAVDPKFRAVVAENPALQGGLASVEQRALGWLPKRLLDEHGIEAPSKPTPKAPAKKAA